MPHRAYYDYDYSRNDDEIMYSALTEPSPCRCVRIVHGRSCPDDLGPRNSPEVIPGDRWAKAKMHNKVVMGFERARENQGREPVHHGSTVRSERWLLHSAGRRHCEQLL